MPIPGGSVGACLSHNRCVGILWNAPWNAPTMPTITTSVFHNAYHAYTVMPIMPIASNS